MASAYLNSVLLSVIGLMLATSLSITQTLTIIGFLHHHSAWSIATTDRATFAATVLLSFMAAGLLFILKSTGEKSRGLWLCSSLFLCLAVFSVVIFTVYPKWESTGLRRSEILYRVNMDYGRWDMVIECGYKCVKHSTFSDGDMQILNKSDHATHTLTFKPDLYENFHELFNATLGDKSGKSSHVAISTNIQEGTIVSGLLNKPIDIRMSDEDYEFHSDFTARTESFSTFTSACGYFKIVSGTGRTVLEVAKFKFFGPLEARIAEGPEASFALSLLPWIQVQTYFWDPSKRYDCHPGRFGRSDYDDWKEMKQKYSI